MNISIFQALSDRTRVRIVEALAGGELPVNDLVGQMDIHQTGVSRHLRILQQAGFVQVRPDGQRRLYSLRPEPFRALDAWIVQYRRLWAGRLDKFAAELEKRQKARAGARRREGRS
jgi:DNA-binding transcriptional ArsR family regulator